MKALDDPTRVGYDRPMPAITSTLTDLRVEAGLIRTDDIAPDGYHPDAAVFDRLRYEGVGPTFHGACIVVADIIRATTLRDPEWVDVTRVYRATIVMREGLGFVCTGWLTAADVIAEVER